MKKLLTLAAAASIASIVATTLPAAAANTVTIKWNIQATASLILEGNYTNTGAGGATAIAPLTIANAGIGTCAGGGAAPVGNGTTALTLDYGNITPDLAQTTGCVGLNAAEAQVSTNDTAGVALQESLTTAPANGESLCGIAIQANKPAAWSATGISSVGLTAATATDTTDTAAASWLGATCAALTYGGLSVNATAVPAAATDIVNTNNDTQNPAYIGEDYVLLVPKLTAKGADQAVVTYTLVTN